MTSRALSQAQVRQGNVLRNNYIHDLGSGNASHVNTMGIYLDDCDCGDTLVGNVFVNCTKQVCSFDGNVKKLLDKFEIADTLL